MDYSKHVSTRATSQRERSIDRTDEVENSAGGFVFAVDHWVRLERFLILGTEGGTYYISEQALTKENASAVLLCIKDDGKRTVETIVDVSVSGRAHKNDPALFALAMAAKLGDNATRTLAYEAMLQVVRTGTMLFQFAQFIEAFGGWGRKTKRAFARWYNLKSPNELAFQMLKYRQRNGWSHCDLIRLCHPSTDSAPHRAMYDVTTHPEKLVGTSEMLDVLPRLYEGFIEANRPDAPSDKVALISSFNLQREMVPSEWLNDVSVNRVLLARMPLMATVRNLGRLTANGTLKPMSAEVKTVVERLTNDEAIEKSRIHPMHYLLALKAYDSGSTSAVAAYYRKKVTEWTPIPQITGALNEGFYKAFDHVEPTGKAFLLGVDVSSSMRSKFGDSNVSSAEAAAAMAMVIARTESNYFIHGFTAGNSRGYASRYRNPRDSVAGFVDLKITANDNLSDACRKVQKSNFGNTDCAVPVLYAKANGIYVDCFVVITDNETWAGDIKPYQALIDYRATINPAAKMVVIATASNGFTIADPNDAGMLDVVGFDASVPQVIGNFVK